MTIQADIAPTGVKYWFTGPSRPIGEADLRIWIERMTALADAAKNSRKNL